MDNGKSGGKRRTERLQGCSDAYALEKIIGLRIMIKEERSRLVAFLMLLSIVCSGSSDFDNRRYIALPG